MGTPKGCEAVAVPQKVVTVIGPVEAPLGTTATISVVEFTTKLAFIPLKRTALGAMKFVPVIVTSVPGLPTVGLKLLIVGVGFGIPVIKKPGVTLKKTLSTASTFI